MQKVESTFGLCWLWVKISTPQHYCIG